MTQVKRYNNYDQEAISNMYSPDENYVPNIDKWSLHIFCKS